MVRLRSCFFKYDWPQLFIALSLVQRLKGSFTHHTITCTGVVVAYHSLQSSTLYRGGGIFEKTMHSLQASDH